MYWNLVATVIEASPARKRPNLADVVGIRKRTAFLTFIMGIKNFISLFLLFSNEKQSDSLNFFAAEKYFVD